MPKNLPIFETDWNEVAVLTFTQRDLVTLRPWLRGRLSRPCLVCRTSDPGQGPNGGVPVHPARRRLLRGKKVKQTIAKK